MREAPALKLTAALDQHDHNAHTRPLQACKACLVLCCGMHRHRLAFVSIAGVRAGLLLACLAPSQVGTAHVPMDSFQNAEAFGLDHLSVSQVQPRTSWTADSALPPAASTGLEDPVHGEITLPFAITPLLKTRPLQRLKALKQLGVCSLVRMLRLIGCIRMGLIRLSTPEPT